MEFDLAAAADFLAEDDPDVSFLRGYYAYTPLDRPFPARNNGIKARDNRRPKMGQTFRYVAPFSGELYGEPSFLPSFLPSFRSFLEF